MPAWSPPAVHVLAKPTGAACNLACAYCFFLDKELLYEGSRFRMADDDLERFVSQLIDAHDVPSVTVAWQGGEPTLMGLDFFRRALALQERYRRPGMVFQNTMQTNGTLLTDEWCEFYKQNGFLIGISIDGPAALHDAYRVDRRGTGTHERAMRGLRLLQKHGVDYNILTTVNRVNADHPRNVYRFLRDEAGTDWIQFIPVVERVDETGSSAPLQGTQASERSVLPDQFGQFLIGVFEEWVHRDVGRVFVQTFEATARNWMRFQTSGMCVFDETCGVGLALEHTGDLYSCDHYVEPEHLLGNIADRSIRELVSQDRQYRFGRDKLDTLPRYCLECDVLFACHGECPKNRFATTPDGEPGLNYLCSGFKAFFHHVDRPMRTMAAVMGKGRPASDVMAVLAREEEELRAAVRRAGRNDPCPCGSGLKTKHCHGRTEGTIETEEAAPLPAVHGRPRPRANREVPGPGVTTRRGG